ncbi:acyltransferase [Pantanalinema rosaneae CENA516]|uniref:acyltransferase n=1 Tax=Pantanalinema rosaneae TaxID=1620701 RepID=UPI003D6FD265
MITNPLAATALPQTEATAWTAPTPSRWRRFYEVLIMTLLEGIPKKPGMLLRQWGYRGFLAQMGRAVLVEREVEFAGTRQIRLGDRVFVGRQVSLKANAPGSQIVLQPYASLMENVRLDCSAAQSRILLGTHATLARGVDIEAKSGGQIEVGEGTYIGHYTCIAGAKIKIGSGCLLGPQVGIFAYNWNFKDPERSIGDQGTTSQGITIEDNCWIGAGAKIVDGVTIGKGSIVGAGAVVTKNVPPGSIALGVPAKVKPLT